MLHAVAAGPRWKKKTPPWTVMLAFRFSMLHRHRFRKPTHVYRAPCIERPMSNCTIVGGLYFFHRGLPLSFVNHNCGALDQAIVASSFRFLSSSFAGQPQRAARTHGCLNLSQLRHAKRWRRRSRARHEGDAAHAPGARDHRPPHSPEQGLRHCKRRVGVGTNQPYDSVFCNIIM